MLEENRFENVLESLRVKRGWRQEDAAAHIKDIGKGISRHTYIDLETGNLPPSEKHLKLIAAGFKLNQADTDALYYAAHHGSPKIHNLPFDRNLLFTGREAQLEQIGQLLKENYRVALSGLAGIGKTQLALEYAHRCYVEKVYQAVLWVSAADEESLQIGYATLAEKLDLPEQDNQEPGKIVPAVKEWLERHTNWLLIMDNADDLELARSFFPYVHRGHILLTTRTQIVGGIARQIEIVKMAPEEAQLFLLRRSRVLDVKATLDTVATNVREAARQIVELLDGHPLALDQAGAFIEDGGSFTTYKDLYEKQRRDLLDRRGSLKGADCDYPVTVAVTFALCFNKARTQHPLADDILNFCAFLHPDAIPDELFQHDDSFKLDTLAFTDGITALLQYSLITRNTQDATLSLHRLVQAVLIDDMPPELRKQWRDRVVRTLNPAFPLYEGIVSYEARLEYWRQCERLRPHAMVCATWMEGEVTQTVEVADLFHRVGIYFLDGHSLRAVLLLRRSLSIYEHLFEAEHPTIAAELIRLGTVYAEQCKHGQAEPLSQQTLAVVAEQLGAEHYPWLIRLMVNLVDLHRVQEAFMLAIGYDVVITRASYDLKHLETELSATARLFLGLATLLDHLGEYVLADQISRAALSADEQRFELLIRASKRT